MKRFAKWLHALALMITLSLGMLSVRAEIPPELKRGINLSHWLQYEGRQPVVATDMAMIRKVGFDHVRVPFNPLRLGWNPDAAPDHQPQLDFTPLDQAVELALQAGLAIILDFHPHHGFYNRLETEESIKAAFIHFWGRLAARYAKYPASRVVFELLNEPQYYQAGGAAQWEKLQTQALARVREAAPDHRVLLSGTRGGSIAGLQLLAPSQAHNLLYVFHFYEPMLFTHLNAPWEPYRSRPEGMITGLIYPAHHTLDQVKLLPGANRVAAWKAVTQYTWQDWGPGRIQQEIGRADSWAKAHRVKLICTEFGVLREGPDPQSRQRWLADTRSALENVGISWTVWDYADVFGLATATGGNTIQGDHAIVPRNPEQPDRKFDDRLLQTMGLLH